MQKIIQVIDKEYQGFCTGCFSKWITCLWGRYDELFTFEENKFAFFYLIEKMLKEGVIGFRRPDDPNMIWDASIQEIIQFLRDKWPSGVVDESDVDLTVYFYMIPSIVWLKRD